MKNYVLLGLILSIPLFTAINAGQPAIQLYSTSFFQTCVNQDASCEFLNLRSANGNIFGKTFFSIRPQDSNTVRRIQQLRNDFNKIECDDFCSTWNLTFQYQRTFSTSNLASWFFFNGTPCMGISIPTTPTEADPISIGTSDVDGNELGLSLGVTPTGDPDNPFTLTTGPLGTICSCPVMDNFIFDLDFYYDLDEILCGLWVRFEAPLVIARTNMGYSTTGKGLGGNGFGFPGAMFKIFAGNADDASCLAILDPVPAVYTQILDAFRGDQAFYQVPPLKNAKFCCGTQTKTTVAGVHADLGYDFYVDNVAYVGASIHAVAPTGNRPKGKFVFEPIVGANKSWQLGLTLETYRLWTCGDNDFGLYFYGIGTHLFKARQSRVFALKNNGAGSQYLLLKAVDPSNATLDGLDRVANVLTGEARIGANFMLDASIMAQWSFCDFFVDLGYNLWVRTQENRSDTVCFRNFEDFRFGLKGRVDTATRDPFLGCVPNSGTAHTTTICQPGEPDLTIDINDDVVTQTITLVIDDIDFTAPLHPTASSHKFFGAIGYSYQICEHDSYILFGSDVEFGKKSKALNQWSVTLEGGIEF